MGIFNVHIFLTHCFLPHTVQVSDKISIQPFTGVGISDVADLIDLYLEDVLAQPSQPTEQRIAMSERIQHNGASTVVIVEDVVATDKIEAIRMTEEIVLICRDLLALRQLQRGFIAGFLSVEKDIDPVRLYSKVRRPYSRLRKVRNIPTGESESDTLTRLYDKATNHPLLKVYLALYADSVAYTDALVTDVSIETRLMKTWSLLEAMASNEGGRNKKVKVKALFGRYRLSTYPDYRNHRGKDLIDIVYGWRSVIAHAGGCKGATLSEDKRFCAEIQSEFEEILEDLSQSCRGLLHSYANSLP